MSKTVYLPYRMLSDRMMQAALKTLPKKLRGKMRQAVWKDAVSQVFQVIGANRTIESNTLIDEDFYTETGCRMYFPETPALLEMLWRAKMSLKVEDFDMSMIPPVFSISWPRCEIAGAKMEGCLVTLMDGHQYTNLFARFGQRLMGKAFERVKLSGDKFSDDEIGLHISYWNSDQPGVLYRASVPGEFLEKCLSSETEFSDFRDSFKLAGMYGTFNLNDEEAHQQYVITKLVVHFLVYMQACPEHIHAGLPDGRKDKEFTSPHVGIKANIITVPPGLKGTHASPEVHWRSWHFRSFPTRKDGTKQKGVVKVSGTLVNAEVDPKTVEDEALRARIKACPQGIVVGH